MFGLKWRTSFLVCVVAALAVLAACSAKKMPPPPPPPPAPPAMALPPTLTNEEYARIEETGFREVLSNPLSTFSSDVDTASYSIVRRFLRGGSWPPPDAVRIEEMVNYFRYSYPEPEHGEPVSITAEMASCPWQPGHQLLSVGIKARAIALRDLPPSNLVFLVDVSGSMASEDKLPLLQKAFRMLTETLRPQDRVSMVVYAGKAGLVLPSTAGSEKQKILRAIASLGAGGSTAGGEGIQLAYRVARENFLKDGNNRVILATDGDFNVGISSVDGLVRLIEQERDSGVYLSVLGVGTGNLKDARMEQLADHGDGNYSYLDSMLEARKVLVQQIGGTLATVAKDVKLQVEFNPAKIRAYRLIGYENRALRAEDFKNDKKDAGDMGAGHTVTALYELIPASAADEGPAADDLKFQKTVVKPGAEHAEALIVRTRYKDPRDGAAREMSRRVEGAVKGFAEASENLRFASSVAQFGMVLRKSEFKGSANLDEVLRAAEGARTQDAEGYRAEFEFLVKTAKGLAVP